MILRYQIIFFLPFRSTYFVYLLSFHKSFFSAEFFSLVISKVDQVVTGEKQTPDSLFSIEISKFAFILCLLNLLHEAREIRKWKS